MTTGIFNPTAGIRKLILILFIMGLILLVAFGGWNLLDAKPEAQTTGSCYGTVF